MELIIGNSVIPLAPTTKLPLVRKSPLFITAENKIPGSYIFNFSIAAGPEIRKEFKQAHRVQLHGRATAEIAYKITDGILRFEGNCVVTQASEEKYDIACKVDNGDLAGRLYNKTLKHLDLGEDYTVADFCCLAYNAEQHKITSDSSVLETLIFPTIYVDLDNNLNPLGGYPFLAKKDGVIKISLQFNLQNFFWDFTHLMFNPDSSDITGELRMYKNGSIFHTYTLLKGINSVNIEEDLTTDDIFYWAVYIVNAGSHLVRFVLSDVFLDYHDNNLFNDTILLDQESSDFTIFPIQNKGLLNNFPDDAFQLDNLSIKTIYSEHFTVLNYWVNGEFPLFMRGYFEGQFVHCGNLFTPFVYMKVILNKIAFEAGYTIENNPFDREFKNLVLFNAYAENNYAGSATSIMPVKQTFNLVDHVPEMAQSDFIKWVALLTGYMPIVDNNLMVIRFVDLKDKHVISESSPVIAFPGILLSNPIVTTTLEYDGIKIELKKSGSDNILSLLAELNDKLVFKGEVYDTLMLPVADNKVNDIYLVTDINEFWIFQYSPENYSLTWCFYSKNFKLVYSEGEEPFLDISTELCPILTSNQIDETISAPVNRRWTLPVTEQSGILEGFPESLGSEYGQQVLYYKGLVNDSLDQPYPLGSIRMSDYESNPDLSPDISAEVLFEMRYKSWLRWLAYETKPVTYKAILTAAQLARIQFDQVYSYGGFNFIVKEIRVNMGMDGLSVVELDIYTV